MTQWEQFKSRVEAAGLRARKCSALHWRIEGGLRDVDWWPTTRTAFVKGWKKGRRCRLSLAIGLALQGTQPKEHDRKDRPPACPRCHQPMRGRVTPWGPAATCHGFASWWQDGINRWSLPADEDTRLARQAAHRALEPLERRMGRNAAYRALAAHLGLSESECHIALFDVDQCKQVIEFAEKEKETENVR